MDQAAWEYVLGFSTSMSLAPKSTANSDNLASKIIRFLISVHNQLSDQIRNRKLFLGLMLLTFISLLFRQFGSGTAGILGVQSSFLPILLVVLVLRVVLLFCLIPGNSGIQEIMIGVVFAAAGFSTEQGLLIGLVTRMVSVVFAGTIGLSGLHSSLELLKTDSIFALVKSISKPRE